MALRRRRAFRRLLIKVICFLLLRHTFYLKHRDPYSDEFWIVLGFEKSESHRTSFKEHPQLNEIQDIIFKGVNEKLKSLNITFYRHQERSEVPE